MDPAHSPDDTRRSHVEFVRPCGEKRCLYGNTKDNSHPDKNDVISICDDTIDITPICYASDMIINRGNLSELQKEADIISKSLNEEYKVAETASYRSVSKLCEENKIAASVSYIPIRKLDRKSKVVGITIRKVADEAAESVADVIRKLDAKHKVPDILTRKVDEKGKVLDVPIRKLDKKNKVPNITNRNLNEKNKPTETILEAINKIEADQDAKYKANISSQETSVPTRVEKFDEQAKRFKGACGESYKSNTLPTLSSIYYNFFPNITNRYLNEKNKTTESILDVINKIEADQDAKYKANISNQETSVPTGVEKFDEQAKNSKRACGESYKDNTEPTLSSIYYHFLHICKTAKAIGDSIISDKLLSKAERYCMKSMQRTIRLARALDIYFETHIKRNINEEECRRMIYMSTKDLVGDLIKLLLFGILDPTEMEKKLQTLDKNFMQAEPIEFSDLFYKEEILFSGYNKAVYEWINFLYALYGLAMFCKGKLDSLQYVIKCLNEIDMGKFMDFVEQGMKPFGFEKRLLKETIIKRTFEVELDLRNELLLLRLDYYAKIQALIKISKTTGAKTSFGVESRE